MASLIELEHIFDALQGFQRPLREGRDALTNIIYMEKSSDQKKSEVKVEALCIRTSSINEEPAVIRIFINKNSKAVED